MLRNVSRQKFPSLPSSAICKQNIIYDTISLKAYRVVGNPPRILNKKDKLKPPLSLRKGYPYPLNKRLANLRVDKDAKGKKLIFLLRVDLRSST
jgi:hypothetical protein